MQIKKFESKISTLPPPSRLDPTQPQIDKNVYMCTITDGPGGFESASMSLEPEKLAANVAKLMANWRAEDDLKNLPDFGPAVDAVFKGENSELISDLNDPDYSDEEQMIELEKIKKQKIVQTEFGPVIKSDRGTDDEGESNSDDYVDVDDDEDSGYELDGELPQPSDEVPEGDSIFEINRAFLKKISEHKGSNPHGWQKLFEEFKNCMGTENNAFKAWDLCQQRTA